MLLADADPRSPSSMRRARRPRPRSSFGAGAPSVGPAHALHLGDHRDGPRECGPALWDEATAASAFADEADLWAFGPDDVHLVCSPMYHSVSIRFAAAPCCRGGTCVVLGRFDPEVARAPVRRSRARADHHLHGAGRPEPPPGRGGRVGARFDSLRLLVHAGSPCPPSLKRSALERVGPGVLWEFYGSTEGQFTVCSPERVGGAARHRGPGPSRAAHLGGRRRDHLVPPSRLRPIPLLAGRGEDRGGLAGRGLHRGRPRSARRRRLPVHRRPPGRPDHQRWGQRLPGRGGGSPGRGGRRVRGRGVRDGRRPLGSAGVCRTGAWAGRPQREAGGIGCTARAAAHAAGRLAAYKRPKQYVVLDALPRTSTGKLQRNLIPARLPAG